MDILIELAKTHGLMAAIGVFLVWSQNKNYTGVCKRLNKVQDYQVDTVVHVVEKNTEAFTRFVEQSKKCKKED